MLNSSVVSGNLGSDLTRPRYQPPFSSGVFSLSSPSQGLLSVFCLQKFGEKPLTSLSVQGSPALSHPLLWLARCESEEQVSGALNVSGTRAGFLGLWAANHDALCLSGAWWQSSMAGAIWPSSLQG